MSNPPVEPAPMAVPPPPQTAIVDGERHVSDVAGGPPRFSRRTQTGAIVAGGVLLIGIVILTASPSGPRPTRATAPPVVASVPPRFEPPPLPARPIVLASAQTPPTTPSSDPPPLPTQPVRVSTSQPVGTASHPAPHPPSSRLLVYTSGGNPARRGEDQSGSPELDDGDPASLSIDGPGSGRDGGQPPVPAADPTSLGARLTPTRLSGMTASAIAHPSYTLTMGTMIPCILQTAMDSTLPGLVTCVVPQDVASKSGITLLDRGTRIVGEFRGGVTQGVERLFVVWSRAETPQSIVINLDSPATDPLGRAGFAGQVERHFWRRFGGALLLTTVDGALQAGVAAASKAGATTVNTGTTDTIVASTLVGSVNLPPTVRKNQGDLVNILVARDLDFSTVYAVRQTTAQAVAAAGAPR